MIPKYVDTLLKQRKNYAAKLNKVATDLDTYCEKIGLPLNDVDIPLCMHVMIYIEPDSAEALVREAIENKLEEKQK